MVSCWYQLYLLPFVRYSASKILVSDLDLSGSPKVKYFYFFRKFICGFILVSCWYQLSISYRLRDIPHLRFRLVPWPFRVTKGQIFHLFWEADMGLYNDLLLIRTLYLVPFARYSTSYTSEDLAGNTTFDLLKVIDLNWFLDLLYRMLALVNALHLRYIA